MAPPQKPFPVSELEQRIHTHSVNLKEKNRKLPVGFDLKRDCDLYELVQYSCTTQAQQLENAAKSSTGLGQIECFPFVRLFRRCQNGDKIFHVETTAWEGQHAWEPEIKEQKGTITSEQPIKNGFAEYGSYFWSKK